MAQWTVGESDAVALAVVAAEAVRAVAAEAAEITARAAANTAQDAVIATDTELADHAADATNIHGIIDASLLITQANISTYAPPTDLSGLATDQELIDAVALLVASIALKQNASTAATDAELATAIGTINAALALKADLIGGLIPTAQLPALAITDVFPVVSQAAMLALTAQRGDVAIRSDTVQAFILAAEPATVLANWLALPTPADAVLSVNGQAGVVVLGKGDVGLANADNTTDATKPVSAPQQTALNLKQDAATAATDAELAAHTGNSANPHSVTKAQVGLGNADNTSDVNKPVSTAQAVANAALVTLAPTTSARNVVQGSAIGVVPLVAKGFAGQTADLQQWQNSAGTPLANVTAAGGLGATSVTSSSSVIANSAVESFRAGNTPAYYVRNTDTNLRTFGVLGSGTLEWRDASGNVDTQFGRSAVDELTAYDRLIVKSPALGTTPLVARGFVGQTAALQEWQDSASAVLARVNNDGSIYTTAIHSPNGTGVLSSGAINLYDGVTAALSILASGSTYVWRVQHIKPFAITTRNAANSADITRITVTYGDNPTQDFSNSSWRFNSPAVGVIPLIVKGFASQTANLQEWQNSAGVAQLSVNSAGALIGAAGGPVNVSTPLVISNYIQSTTGLLYLAASGSAGPLLTGVAAGDLTFQSGASSATGTRLIVKGIATGQTSNLQEWQDSAAAVRASMNLLGQYRVAVDNTAPTGISVGASGTAVVQGVAGIEVQPAAAGRTGILVRGFASQTANLQEWQNSAAGVLAYVDSAGGFRASSNIEAKQGALRTLNSGNTITAQIGGTSNYFLGRMGVGQFDSSTQTLIVQSTAVAEIPIVAKGFAGQTGNLQQWQNSAAVVLAAVDIAGTISAAGDIISVGKIHSGTYLQATNGLVYLGPSSGWPTIQGVSVTDVKIEGGNAVAATTLIIKGKAAQTANLQQWQDSAAVVKAFISAGGDMTVNGGTGLTVANVLNVQGGDARLASNSAILRMGGTLDTSLSRPTAGVLQIDQNGGGLRLKSPDGLTTKTITIDNAGALALI